MLRYQCPVYSSASARTVQPQHPIAAGERHALDAYIYEVMQQHLSYLQQRNCVGHSQLAAFTSYRQAGYVHALSMARLTAAGLLLRSADMLFNPGDNSMSTEGPQPLSSSHRCGSSNPHMYFQHSCCPISRRMFAWAGALVSGRQTKMICGCTPK